MNLGWVIVGLIISLLGALIVGLGWNWDKWHKKDSENKPKVEITDSILKKSPVVVDSPGAVVGENINQKRAISSKYEVRKKKQGEAFVLEIILNQSNGIWDQGEIFKLQINTSGPYREARIVSGMPGSLLEEMISENKEQGFFSYSTITAPLSGVPIVIEIGSDNEIDLIGVKVNPIVSEN